MFVHGHTHDGKKADKLHGVQILNPGPLLKKKYGSYILENEGNQIQLMSYEFSDHF